jgi:hypothetical protein
MPITTINYPWFRSYKFINKNPNQFHMAASLPSLQIQPNQQASHRGQTTPPLQLRKRRELLQQPNRNLKTRNETHGQSGKEEEICKFLKLNPTCCCPIPKLCPRPHHLQQFNSNLQKLQLNPCSYKGRAQAIIDPKSEPVHLLLPCPCSTTKVDALSVACYCPCRNPQAHARRRTSTQGPKPPASISPTPRRISP